MVGLELGMKKRKVEETLKVSKPSKIFSPFRVIGNVTNETPFAVGTLGSTFYIATSVGRSFQIYDANTLHLLFVSKQQARSRINYLHAHFHYVYCCFDHCVGIYKRGNLEHLIECDTQETINRVLTFGDYLICSSASEIFVYKKTPGSKVATEFYTSFKINSLDGQVVDIVHPATYLNKIVIATTSHLLVFNVKTGKLLFTSEVFTDLITTISSAPVLDVLAVGFNNGEFGLYNMKKGKLLKQVSTGNSTSRVTSLSFRTDGSSHLVASLSNGDLFFYDLDRKCRIHVLKSAHREQFGGVAKLEYLHGQPVVVTNGGDNQLKEYCFDPALSTSNSSIVSPPRHLRSRGGHSAPPSSITFADDKSHFVLSASQDRSFWKFSMRKDAQSLELSQRAQKPKDGKRQGGPTLKEKFPEIVTVAYQGSREGEWENVLTGHRDETFARTWDSKTMRVGRWQLATVDGGLVKTVAITECGNFGLVGSSTGGIAVYNLQSGIQRKRYLLHKKCVTGIAVDGMNRKMVSCGLDGVVGFYDFGKSKFLGKLQLGSPITQLVYHKSSDLVALALDDLTIVVVDAVTQKVVRMLYGHSNRITSMDFSKDGRWLISASLDSTLRTWDLPTGGCIDGVRVGSVITNVKVSPSGDMLATTHVNDNGISLWTNRAQFRAVSTRQVEEEDFSTIVLPNVSGEGGASILEGAIEREVDDADSLGKYLSAEQINSDMITLSLEPKSKFNTLLHLDTIKLRNKPKGAPKKPEKLPFFLSLGGEAVGDRAIEAEDGLNTSTNEREETLSSESKLSALRSDVDKFSFESEFTKLLRLSHQLNDYNEILKFLVTSSPASVDLEIRSLNTLAPYSELVSFVSLILEGVRSNKDFELMELFMNMFLKAHGDVIYLLMENEKNDEETSDEEDEEEDDKGAVALLGLLEDWEELSSKKVDNLDSLAKYCSGVINFLTTV